MAAAPDMQALHTTIGGVGIPRATAIRDAVSPSGESVSPFVVLSMSMVLSVSIFPALPKASVADEMARRSKSIGSGKRAAQKSNGTSRSPALCGRHALRPLLTAR